MKVIIIGAGPAGLSCAYKLVDQGHEVDIYEASPYLGGMSRSFDLWGQRVDLGPHRFFSKEKEINEFFFDVIKDDYTLVDRQTRIFYNNRYFEYPLKLMNVLGNLRIWTIIQILWYYFIQQIHPIQDPKNFEEWVTNRFGKKLYEIFFKNYTEKLWGIKCTEIDADWAAQRIKSLSLFEAVKAAFFGNRGNKHKTLVDQFAYPNDGTGTIYERAANYVKSKGGKINISTPIMKVVLDEMGTKVIGVETKDKQYREADMVVSTMPLTQLIKGFKNIPDNVTNAANQLSFRNTILVYLEIDKTELFTDNWLYIHSPDVRHGRITNFRNWSKSLNRDKTSTIVCMEFWCFEDDAIWADDEKFVIELAKKEVREIKLIPTDAKIINSTVVKVPKCYPIYNIGYQKHLNTLTDFLNPIKGLFPIGRYGAFKYNNQDHSILMGLLAAKIINGEKDIDLWAINTDTEYQEEGEIKDVLVQ